jgi:hypothetical protein
MTLMIDDSHFGWKQQARSNKTSNIILFTVTDSGHFEPSNSGQQFKIQCCQPCKVSKPASVFHARFAGNVGTQYF